MIPTGHASSREKDRMAALEAKLGDQAISPDERLELALLYLEPGHDGLRAAELLEGILAVDPGHDVARMWLAHCLIYEWMDEEALRRAVELCNALLDERLPADLRAAGLMLKAAALRLLPDGDDPLPLLLQSINLAPTWISNRLLLSNVYQDQGDRKAAEQELLLAKEALGSYAGQLFEELITGRGGDRVADFLEDQIRTLARESS